MENHDFRIIAIEAHAAQDYAGLPYAIHLASVERVLHDFEYVTYRWQAAAWLHDIIEDSEDWDRTRVQETFGEPVAKLVYAVSGFGENRKERNKCIYDKIRSYPEAGILKVADRIVNCEFSRTQRSEGKLNMYLKEFPEFFANVNSAAIPQAMWDRLIRAIHK